MSIYILCIMVLLLVIEVIFFTKNYYSACCKGTRYVFWYKLVTKVSISITSSVIAILLTIRLIEWLLKR